MAEEAVDESIKVYNLKPINPKCQTEGNIFESLTSSFLLIFPFHPFPFSLSLTFLFFFSSYFFIDVPILGAETYSPSMYVKLIQRFGIEREVAEHLARRQAFFFFYFFFESEFFYLISQKHVLALLKSGV